MGQNNFIADPQLGFDPNQWIQAIEDTSSTRFPNVNPYRHKLFMNKNTSELIQQYEVQFMNQADFTSFLSELQLRKESRSNHKLTLHHNSEDPIKNNPYIYKIRHFRNLSVQQICTTIYTGLLYIDKVDVRLKEVNDIPFQDHLYLYRACLSGFKLLYEKVGVFEITEQMIFFDQKGKVKVWMNPNLAKFQPNYEPEFYNNVNYIETQGSQSQMLRNLINIIENNIDNQSFSKYPSFRDYLKENSIIERLSFSKTQEYFENYLQEYKLCPGNYLTSIYQLFHFGQQNLKESRQSSEINFVHFRREQKKDERGSFNAIPGAIPKDSSQEKTIKKIQQNNHLDKSSASINSGQNSTLMFGNSKRPHFNNRSFNSPPPDVNSRIEFKKKQLNGNVSSKIQQRENPPPVMVGRQINGRSALTFNPSQFKQQQVNISSKINPSQRVERYSSLDRFSNFNFGSNSKGITFSYKKQVPSIQPHIHPFSPQKHMPEPLLRRQSIIDKLAINSQSANTTKTVESSSGNNQRNKIKESTDSINTLSSKKMNYFTSDSEYHLDQQIAEDLVKYLSFNPNKP